MSILQRIQERQAGGISEQVAAMDAQMVESQKPDAVAQAKEGRAAYSDAFRNVAEDGPVSQVAAGPEEQASMTKMEKAMLEMVHGPQMTGKMLKAISSAQDPVHGIGTIASDIVLKLQRELPGATEDVLAALGQRAVEEITELAELANPRLNLSEDDMAEAYSIGVQSYMKSGMAAVDEDELRGFLANG